MPALEFCIATVNIFLCYIFFAVQTVLNYEGHTDLTRNTLYSQLENSDLRGRHAPRREGKEHKRENQQKPHISQNITGVKKEKSSTWH